MYYEAQIQRALENRPLVAVSAADIQLGTITPIGAPGPYAFFKPLADSDLIDLNHDDEWRTGEPNEVVVSSGREMRMVLGELAVILGTPTIREYIAQVDHEEAHEYVAKRLQATCAGAFFLLLESISGGYLHTKLSYAARLTAPKLGVAALLARPHDPSPDDVHDLVDMGYEGGVDEVGSRIVARNKRLWWRKPIPVPLSYRPGRTYL